MIDSNFKYIVYPNLPQEYIEQLKDIAQSAIPEGILGDNSIIDYSEYPQMFKCYGGPFDINGASFECRYLITKPNSGKFVTHTDGGRSYGLNIPIQVDFLKGYFLVYNGEDHSDDTYPELGNSIKPFDRELPPEIRAMFNAQTDEELYRSNSIGRFWWPHPKITLFKKVTLNRPLLINAKLPHTFVNYGDTFRVIASLRPTTNSDDELFEALAPFI